MFLKAILLISFRIVLSIPTNNNGDVSILRSGKVETDDGGYQFFYETSDGQKRDETDLINDEGNIPYLKVEGVYSYVGPDGQRYQVNYIADKDGFRLLEPQVPTYTPTLRIADKPLRSLGGGGNPNLRFKDKPAAK